MKKCIKVLCFALIFVGLYSCIPSTSKSGKPSSSGKTLELLVAIDDEVYRGEVKDSIQHYFGREQVGLNQAEPIFDIVRLPLSSVNNTSLFRVHRNILIIDKDPKNENQVYYVKNKWAEPQTIIQFSVSSNAAFFELLDRDYEKIIELLYRTERERMIRAFKSIANYELINKIKENFGFELAFSNDFVLSLIKKDFAWIRKETKDMSIGILIHTFPYTDSSVFNPKKIVSLRNQITEKYILGPKEGTYMAVEQRVTPFSKKIRFNSSYGVETRGLWRLEGGDFMGGPFVNYLFLDPSGRNVIMLDAYVYHPNAEKRDLLLQGEAICYSIAFSDQRKEGTKTVKDSLKSGSIQ